MIDGVFKDSIDNFQAFDARNRRIALGQGFTKGNFIDDNRNELVRDVLMTPADYLLMLDTDVEFEPQHPYILLDEAVANDRAILSGIYFSFIIDGKLRPVWFTDGVPGGPFNTFGDFMSENAIVPLGACGMGFCLIRRDVFEKMLCVPEWMASHWTWFARDPYNTPDGMIRQHGEDLTFCLRAKKVGFQTWGHKGVELRHWKKTPLDAEMFRLFVEDSIRRGIEY
jgi:hypothetical protein